MKETTCKKCGEVYDSNYKACPNCGFNPFRYALKIAGIAVLCCVILATFVLSIITLVKQNALSDKIDNIQIYASGNQGGSMEVDLNNYTFYDDYLLGEGAVLDNLGDDYFLYFHSDTCGACKEANNYILSYYNIPVSKDSKDYIYDEKPVYFITTESNEALFNEFNIDSTPTMIRMIKGKEDSRAIGVDEVNSMFEKVVLEYYPE